MKKYQSNAIQDVETLNVPLLIRSSYVTLNDLWGHTSYNVKFASSLSMLAFIDFFLSKSVL